VDEPKAPRVDYFRLLRRVVHQRWKLVVVGFVTIMLPTLGWVLFGLPTIYEASAVIVIVPEKGESALLRNLIAPETSSVYLAILSSRSLAQAVTEALPKESRDELSKRVGFPDYLLTIMNAFRRLRGEEVVVYSPTEIAVRELQEARMTFIVSKEGTVTITATAFNPRISVDLANTYVDVLIARSNQFARQQNRSAREMLENLLSQARTSQTDAEESLRKFQVDTGNRVKLPDGTKLEVMKLAQLESSLFDVQVNREIAQQKLQYLRGQGAGKPDKSEKTGNVPLVPDLSAQVLRERLTHLEAKLTALTEKYTEEHPVVQATRTEVEDARARLRSALQGQPSRPGGAGPQQSLDAVQIAKQMADLEVEVISAQAREQGLRQRLAETKRTLAVMGSKEQEYADLVRTVEGQRSVSGMLADKLATARIGEQGQIRGIQVLDLAALPRQPSSKQMLRTILLGLGAGLGVGLGLGTLREHALQVIETEEEAEATARLPVLGSIPTLPGRQLSRGPISFTGANAALSLSADACRGIRIALQCQRLDQPLRSLIVTSPGVGEGKSTLLLNLAWMLLETNHRVIVIDADLRRPALHRAFGVPNERGLAELLRRGDSELTGLREIAPGLEFLPAGSTAGNPSTLLSSKQMVRILEAARERADFVLIDSPPVLAVSDTLPLMTLVDGVVLVIRAGMTQRHMLERAQQLLERAGATVVGLAVNRLNSRDARRYYSAYDAYVDGEKGQKKSRWGRR
jgi:polysaccharide biosynthesis transport protein